MAEMERKHWHSIQNQRHMAKRERESIRSNQAIPSSFFGPSRPKSCDLPYGTPSNVHNIDACENPKKTISKTNG